MAAYRWEMLTASGTWVSSWCMYNENEAIVRDTETKKMVGGSEINCEYARISGVDMGKIQLIAISCHV